MHFFAVSAQVMRRILVERARRQNIKRGRSVQHLPLDEIAVVSDDPPVDFIAVDDALNALARLTRLPYALCSSWTDLIAQSALALSLARSSETAGCTSGIDSVS